MIGALLLAASAIALPEMSRTDWAKISQRYPAWALRAGKSAATVVEVVIEPDGTARECKVAMFVGDEQLANQECDVFRKAKFKPAIGPDGQPIQSKYREYIARATSGKQRWQVEHAVRPADMALTVNRLDDGKSYFDMRLELLVDAQGAVAACETADEDDERKHAALARAACGEAARLTIVPLVDREGHAASHVTNLLIRFEVAS